MAKMQKQYVYEPLLSDFHTRLLKIKRCPGRSRHKDPELSLVQKQLGGPDNVHDGLQTDERYECISYVWAGPRADEEMDKENAQLTATLASTRKGSNADECLLRLGDEQGDIKITKSLAQALPYLCREATANYIWIDQLCIDQSKETLDERSSQVARMGEIYSHACRTIVWMGSQLRGLDTLLKVWEEIMWIPSATYCSWPFIRQYRLIKLCTAIFSRSWFKRGWVVQEFVQAPVVCFLFGNQPISGSALVKIAFHVARNFMGPTEPVTLSRDAWRGAHACLYMSSMSERPIGGHWLTDLSDSSHQGQLKRLWICAEVFETTESKDRILAYLGLLPDLKYRPNLRLKYGDMLVEIATCILKQSRRLDILTYTRLASNFSPSWVLVWRHSLGSRYSQSSTMVEFGRTVPFGSPGLHWQAWPEDLGESREPAQFQIGPHNSLIVLGKVLGDTKCVKSVCHQILLGLPDKHPIEPTHKLWDYCKVLWDSVQLPDCETWEPWEDTESNRSLLCKKIESLEDGDKHIISVGEDRFGVAAKEVHEDCIAVVRHNCFVPLILMRTSSRPGCYKVVCCAYIEGVMHGEAVTGIEGPLQQLILV